MQGNSRLFLAMVTALLTASTLSKLIVKPVHIVAKATAEMDFINSFKLLPADTKAHDAVFRLALSQDRYKVALYTDVYLGTEVQKERFMLDTGKNPKS